MKKVFLSTVFSILLILSVQAQEFTLDEVMHRYYEAGNLKKLQEVSTIVMKGFLVQQDIMPLKIIRKRPDKFLMEYDVVDMTTYQGYDGETAWMTTPWTGMTTPQPMTPDRTAEMRYRADFDGLLVDWKAKGFRAALEGVDTLETGPAHKISLIRADSITEYYFIDVRDFLLTKQITAMISHGQKIPVEVFFRNYREVEGIPFPFLIQLRYAGRSIDREFETIEVNRPVEDDLFRMPE